MSEWQERLVEAMDARGITGGELGRRTGFSAQYINSLRSKDRGARLPLDTARKLAAALGVAVEWLTSGNGPRERLSDVYPIYVDGGSPESATFHERYAGRAEAVALLSTSVEPEVIAALRAVVPEDPESDPGRESWIDYARNLVRDLLRIKSDPVFNSAAAPQPAPPPPAPKKAVTTGEPPKPPPKAPRGARKGA